MNTKSSDKPLGLTLNLIRLASALALILTVALSLVHLAKLFYHPIDETVKRETWVGLGLLAILGASPYAIALCLLRRRPNAFATGMSLGVGVTVCAGFILEIVAGMVLNMMAPPPLSSFAWMIPLNAVLAVAAVASLITYRKMYSFPMAFLGFVAGAVLAAMGTVGSSSAVFRKEVLDDSTLHKNYLQGQQLSNLWRLTTRLQFCSFEYRSADPDSGLPGSLETLLQKEGSCIGPDLQKQRAQGLNIFYVARRDDSGKVIGDQLTTQYINTGRSCFIDETGLMRCSESGTATSKTRPFQFHDLTAAVRFLDGYEESHASFPRNLSEVYPNNNPYRYNTNIELKQNQVVVTGYILTYTPEKPKKNGSIPSYELRARPWNRGNLGDLRSYFVDKQRMIHATPEPREATIDDPVVPDCEIPTEHNGKTNTPTECSHSSG